ERLALGFGLQVRLRIALDGLVDLARRSKKGGAPATKDPTMRQKLAQLWIDTEVFKYTGARAITKLLKGELPGPEASAGKMMWVEGHQRLQELAMELQGPYAQLGRGSTWAVGGLALLEAGSDAQKKTWLPKLCSGEARATLAWMEPSAEMGAAGITLQAAAKGSGFTLSGTKLFVHDAHTADVIVVAARTASG